MITTKDTRALAEYVASLDVRRLSVAHLEAIKETILATFDDIEEPDGITWDEFERRCRERIARRLSQCCVPVEKSNHAEADIDGEPVQLDSNWVSIKQAASLTGRSETGIRKLRRLKKIDAINRGYGWRINMRTVKPKSAKSHP